jgi:hypothetical protein
MEVGEEPERVDEDDEHRAQRQREEQEPLPWSVYYEREHTDREPVDRARVPARELVQSERELRVALPVGEAAGEFA